MRGWRESAAGVAAAGLVLGGACGSSALASTADEERVFRQDALGHAEAVASAYRRLEEHILLHSTALTSWSDYVRPVPRWPASWIERGVQARYCDDTLLVYLNPARLKGVGEDHRSVHVAPHAFVGEGNDGRFPALHWLVGNVVQVEGKGGVVSHAVLPSCMTGDPLPSGRAALVGRVKDPFDPVNMVEGVAHEVETRACPAGWHGPGQRWAREIRQKKDGRGVAVGVPDVGPWKLVADACSDRLPDPPPATIDEIASRESMSVACGQGFTGSRRYTRVKTTRSTQFPWDSSPVVTVRYTSWSLASSSCAKIEDPVEPRKCEPPEDCEGTLECVPGTEGCGREQGGGEVGGGEEPPKPEPGRRTVDVDKTRERPCPAPMTGTYVETQTVRYEYELYENGSSSVPVVIGTGAWWMSADNCEWPPEEPGDDRGRPPGVPGTPGGGACGPPGDGSASPGEGQCTGVDSSIAAAVAAATGSGGGAGAGGGGCYLTTAVVEHRGIEGDDGPTLTALRHFRDTYMMRTPVRRALVRLYYRLAPSISRDLDRDSPAWEQIGRHIDSAVEALESGDTGKAFRAYWAASMRAFSLWAVFKVKRALA